MSLVVNCPSCDARVTAPHSAVGKRVKCPKCGTGIAVTDDEDDERPVRSRRRDDDDADDDRPRRKARRRDDDEEDDEEDDDRPRREKSAGKRGGPPVILFVALGGGLVVLCVVAAVLFFVFSGKSTGPGGVFGPSAPAGYTAVREPAGGFAVFLPGAASKVDTQDKAKLGHHGWMSGGGQDGQEVWVWSRPVPAGFNPGTDPDGLVQLLGVYEHHVAPANNSYELVGKRSVTLGGKPGVEVKLKQKPHLMSQPGDNGFFAERDKEETERVARDGEHHVFFVTHNGKQVFIIHVSRRKGFPADDVLKTIADSFALI